MSNQKVKTSQSHPLRIDVIELDSGGMIGMTFCPGKKQKNALSGEWDRDLDTDLQVIVDWGATAIISLIEEHEFVELDVTELPMKIKKAGIEWHHLPIKDRGIPTESFEEEWNSFGKRVHDILHSGEKIVIHCMGGLGRTGLVAARLLVELGETTDNSINRVRLARRGAIETLEQLEYVSGFIR